MLVTGLLSLEFKMPSKCLYLIYYIYGFPKTSLSFRRSAFLHLFFIFKQHPKSRWLCFPLFSAESSHHCRETEEQNEAARSTVQDQTPSKKKKKKERLAQGLKEEAAETLLG